MDIEGTAALVTGGGSGLGEATARALAQAGAQVAVLDRDAEAAQAVAMQIGGAAFACDVSDAASAQEAIEAARQAHGTARILVNCAGIAPVRKILGRQGVMALEEFAGAVTVNLVGSFNMLRLFSDRVQHAEPGAGGERGVAINTASIAAYEGQIGQTAYAASKGGVVGMTLPAARELAPLGIRVCAIAPGIFETAMLKGLPEAAQDSLGASVPFPSRLGRPAEFADLVCAILRNQMLNGETIRLDGALRMAPR
ncbi:SDR family NAD(P)-dependent oxidoreductase [Profundibacterium mesophilum]|uniref:3-hydroxyacyl-CoA dehydrogenase 3-hydroxy-2-methylbutyryl-CoA dehydrogenase n=1 Tax=Profundibacterium mesophilum KAUST100406-0324 TaxID=1037889 RepID=A0A921NWF8_9RHOB|nr:SDR family NAD(P)-dependent oxidoreductase [Profundibacterium mesophilum]KAF0676014.1 3-hydroxyacyl-CoA dehydrogenase 3-hydroxy-2-methylbutyryl-CoA dehydrogenase [Profundibacterium mesophilum KAUST100406-0324]